MLASFRRLKIAVRQTGWRMAKFHDLIVKMAIYVTLARWDEQADQDST